MRLLDSRAQRDVGYVFNSVSTEHPNFAACLLESLDCDPGIILQSFFDPGHSKEVHVGFDFGQESQELLISLVFLRFTCFIELGQKCITLFLSQYLLGNDQRPQPFFCQLVAELKRDSLLLILDLCLHDGLCSFGKVDNLPSFPLVDESRLLAHLTCEREISQDIKVLHTPLRVSNLDKIFVSLEQFYFRLLCILDQGDLIRTACEQTIFFNLSFLKPA